MDNADIMPDLAIGRIPVSTLEDAQIVVDKTIGYEQSPPMDADFYDNTSFASYFQCCQDPITFGVFEFLGVEIPEVTLIDGVDMRAYVETAELVRDHLMGEGYTLERIYTTDTTYNSGYAGNTAPDRYYDGSLMPSDLNRSSGFPWDGDTQDIVDAVNEGRFLVLHRDHGSSSGWSKPSFRTSDLGSLSNGELLPVIFSVDCASGRFDGTSGWAEQIPAVGPSACWVTPATAPPGRHPQLWQGLHGRPGRGDPDRRQHQLQPERRQHRHVARLRRPHTGAVDRQAPQDTAGDLHHPSP